MDTVRLMLVGDYRLYLDGLRAVLEGQPGIALCADLPNTETAPAHVLSSRPDLVIVDIHYPLHSCISAIRHLMNQDHGAKVLAIVSCHDREALTQVVQAGASGYVDKHSCAADFISAIRDMAEGGAVIDPALALELLADYRRLAGAASGSKGQHFTDRDLTILRLLAAGAGNRQIAQHLFLSEQTVKNLLSDLYRRLQAENRTDAVTRAIRQGLIQDSVAPTE